MTTPNSERREHERIEVDVKTRLWLDEAVNGKSVMFEGFAQTRNLSIAGAYIESSYALPVGSPINLDINLDPRGEILRARGEVINNGRQGRDNQAGMGIAFTAVDEDNRERLLRYFVSERIATFYHQRFVAEFPKLRESLSLQDVALIINLWEDREQRLSRLQRPQQSNNDRPGRSKTTSPSASRGLTSPSQSPIAQVRGTLPARKPISSPLPGPTKALGKPSKIKLKGKPVARGQKN